MSELLDFHGQTHANRRPRWSGRVVTPPTVSVLHGVPNLAHRSVNGSFHDYVKRSFDVLATLMGGLLLLPLMLLVAIAIKLDSPGPVFYRQRRVGLHGHPFFMLKFRSMHLDADERLRELMAHNTMGGPLFKMKNDPRITRIGKLIRKTSIDELPQLWNVFIGEMSLVGPRPPISAEVAKFESWHLAKFEVMPGITGLWQVSGRSKLTFQQMLELDLQYIREWSLWLDLKILLRTVSVVLRCDGAH